MISRWEVLPAPEAKYPNRYRVNIAGEAEDLELLKEIFKDKVGKIWTPRKGFFNLSFYFFPSGDDVQRLEKILTDKSSTADGASVTAEGFEQEGELEKPDLEIETASEEFLRVIETLPTFDQIPETSPEEAVAEEPSVEEAVAEESPTKGPVAEEPPATQTLSVEDAVSEERTVPA